MARRKLTDEERLFRKIGSGIPFSRWWPVVAIFIGFIFASLNSQFVATCTGINFDDIGSRGTSITVMLFAYPCSLYLLRDGLEGGLLFLGLWLPWPFAFVNWRWAKRQRRFWNNERLREQERRKAKREAAALEDK
jgi:hypothetical protein